MNQGKTSALLAAFLLTAACGGGSRQPEMQAKVDTLQKEYDEKKKELEAAKLAAAQEPEATMPSNVPANRADMRTNPASTSGRRAAATDRALFLTLKAGTPIVVRTTNKLSTKTNASGSSFEASLEQALEVDGVLLAPRGAMVGGVITNSDEGGRVKGRPTLTVALRRITLADGQALTIRTSDVTRVSEGSLAKDASKVAIASGVGAAIGAIAGGGKGAAIGAGIGAGGGTAGILLTKGKPAEIPAETVLRFTLTADAKTPDQRR